MKVKSIVEKKVQFDENDNVDYNIYIDTDSVFFSAEPILNHRYPKWHTKSDDEIAELVNEIAADSQEYINTFYDIFAKRFFNLNKHRLEIKKEFVSKSGIWLAKKRYAQWIISDNGVPVDRLDVKGLDVVRSSYPTSFKEIMSTVLIDILKDVDSDTITKKINKFRQELHTIDVTDVAKNSSVKNLTKYLPSKSEAKNKSLFSFKKGTPAHVKAAIAFNKFIKYFDCPYKYPPLRNGEKIKWVYLKTNPYGVDGLAFRGDEDPPEIMSIINEYIDYEKIFQKELLGKLQVFYDALGWGEVLSSKKKAEQFFSF